MTFDQLLERFHREAFIDYASVALFFPESAESIRTALYRFKRGGKLLELRRGLYAFAERYRKAPLSGPAIAGTLYQPSYLSGIWALAFHGCIPEKVVDYISVAPRPTKSFENDWGRFIYRSVKQAYFFGFRTESIMDASVRIASPEKALVDLWYLEEGEWTEGRMESMRFEPGTISSESIIRTVAAYNQPRLARAAAAWLRFAQETLEGRVDL
ncbi:MAG: hypothetical protein Q8M76_13270 [Spirochaetaceae bacterium]|nr:hypothetical protein [Spirochaetaceae bacterium]